MKMETTSAWSFVDKQTKMASIGKDGKDVLMFRRMRAARLSGQQFEMMIQYMAEHPQFAAGRAGGSRSKEEHDMLWQELTQQLNDTVGPVKSATKWQKCWVDLKSNARSRAAKLRASSIRGRAPVGGTFTQWDEQVLQLLSDIGCLSSDTVPTQDISPNSPANLVEVSLNAGKSTLKSMNHSQLASPPELKYFPSTFKPTVCNGSSENEPRIVKVEHLEGLDLSVPEETSNGLHEGDGGDIDSMYTASSMEEEDEKTNESGDESHFMPNCTTDAAFFAPDQLPCPPLTPIRPAGSVVRKFPQVKHSSACHMGGESDGQDVPWNSKKRKQDTTETPQNLNEFLEGFSKNVGGALERMATAAEEANVIQRGMITAMNRLATTFEQLIPLLGTVVANGADVNK